jgi:hypothetical protein
LYDESTKWLYKKERMIGYNTMKKTHVQQEWDDIKIYYEQQQKKV